MGTGCWIESVYGMGYGYRIVKGTYRKYIYTFGIIIGKLILNDYWIVYVFRIVSVFGI